MLYEVYKVDANFSKEKEIDKITNFKWNDSLNNVFTNFELSTINKLSRGDLIELYHPYDKKTVLYGEIQEIEVKDFNFFTYKGRDLGDKIAKTDNVTIQYTDEDFEETIKRLCSKSNIKYIQTSDIQSIDKKIKKDYRYMSCQDILYDLYKIILKQGVKDEYYFTCQRGGLEFLKYSENNDLKGYIANLYQIKSLEHIEKIDLRITDKENLTVNVKVDYNAQKGVISQINLNLANEYLQNLLNGKYLITSSKHNITGTIENVELSIQKV